MSEAILQMSEAILLLMEERGEQYLLQVIMQFDTLSHQEAAIVAEVQDILQVVVLLETLLQAGDRHMVVDLLAQGVHSLQGHLQDHQVHPRAGHQVEAHLQAEGNYKLK